MAIKKIFLRLPLHYVYIKMQKNLRIKHRKRLSFKLFIPKLLYYVQLAFFHNLMIFIAAIIHGVHRHRSGLQGGAGRHMPLPSIASNLFILMLQPLFFLPPPPSEKSLGPPCSVLSFSYGRLCSKNYSFFGEFLAAAFL